RRVGGRAVAQLTGVVATPTLDGSVPEQRAGMCKATRDGDDTGEAAHGDRCRGVGGRAVAQLAVEVAAPALDGPVREQRARMREVPRHSDRDRPGDAGYGYWYR